MTGKLRKALVAGWALLWLCCPSRWLEAAVPEPTEAVLEVALAGNAAGETMVVLRGASGEIFLEESDLRTLRLPLPERAPLLHAGKRYFQPTAIPGCTLSVDEANQRVVVSPPAAALDATHLSAPERQRPPLTPASPGAFLNYQLSAQQVDGRSLGGAYTELGLFAGAGVLTNTALGRYGDNAQFVRLESTYTRDFPDSLDTLDVGDTISDGASWGYAERFAGIRFAKNFGLRPDLLTTPLLTAAGTATVPSTVDVFVNNQLVNSSQVPAGPFVVDKLPTVSGTGDVSLVVRDALGREQVVSQSFYSSTVLLAKGLSQYSLDVGSIRENYGLKSDDYGPPLVEGSCRRGISDALTLEGHAEYLQDYAHAAGINAALALGAAGVVNVTAGAGGDRLGSGTLTGIGFEHRGGRFSVVSNSLWASHDFAQVGEPADADQRMRARHLLQLGTGLGRFGSASLAYVEESYRAAPMQQTLALTQSVSLGHAGTLSFTLSHTRTAAYLAAPSQSSMSAYLIYVLPLDFRRAVTLSTVGGSGSGAAPNEAVAALTESPPVGPGSGYRLSLSDRGNYDADWRQQLRGIDLEAEAARNNGLTGQSFYASGAFTFLDGELNTTRQINGSFAMVDVAGIADVPVYVENQLVAHTDADGKALLYNLRPYEANRISIVPEELPLDTALSASSTVMAPPYRSGVVARFPVTRVHAGTFRLILPDGAPVPVGATVTLKGVDFPVVRDGMVYVTGYAEALSAQAHWPGGRCDFRLQAPPPNDPQPDLGAITCRRSPAVSSAGRQP